VSTLGLERAQPFHELCLALIGAQQAGANIKGSRWTAPIWNGCALPLFSAGARADSRVRL